MRRRSLSFRISRRPRLVRNCARERGPVVSVVPAKPTGRANARPMTGSARAGTHNHRRLWLSRLEPQFSVTTKIGGYASPRARTTPNTVSIPHLKPRDTSHTSTLPRRHHVRALNIARPEKSEGAGNAGRVRRTRSLACKIKKHASKSPQVRRNTPAFPARMVLTACFVLFPVIGLSCHRHPREASAS